MIMKYRVLPVVALLGLMLILWGCPDSKPVQEPAPMAKPAPKPLQDIVLATTTSVNDTGLLDVLTQKFKAEAGINVKPIAVGTGKALALGERGEADVVLVHAPPAEEAFIRAGHAVKRITFMHNYMLIAGPQKDPAKIAKAKSVADALIRIAKAEKTFVSRGDDSGTHKKERELWALTDMQPAGEWYLESGQGMANTLRIADEKQAYILTDFATYLSVKKSISLVPLFEKSKDLLNVYSAMVVNPKKHPNVKSREAEMFIKFLIKPEIQKMIGEYGTVEYGLPLFIPSLQDDSAKKETKETP